MRDMWKHRHWQINQAQARLKSWAGTLIHPEEQARKCPHCPLLSWAIDILKEWKTRGIGEQARDGRQGHGAVSRAMGREAGGGCQNAQIGVPLLLRLGELEGLIGYVPCQRLNAFARVLKLSRIEQGR